MEEKRCPEPGCGGVLVKENNESKKVYIYICAECHTRYKSVGGDELKKTEGHIIYNMECAAC